MTDWAAVDAALKQAHDINDVTKHLLMHKALGERLRREADLVRRTEQLDVRRNPITYWWEVIVFAIFRTLGRYVASRMIFEDSDGFTKEETMEMFSDIRPDRFRLVEMFAETREEYEARLRALALQPTPIGAIQVHESAAAPPSTAYLFDPTRVKIDHEGGYKFDPKAVAVVRTVPLPSVASVILSEPADNDGDA